MIIRLSAILLATITCLLPLRGNALSWSTPLTISPTSGPTASLPKLKTDGNGVWISTWQDGSGGTNRIYFSRSDNFGLSWSSPAVLSGPAAGTSNNSDEGANIATDRSGHWVVVWNSNRRPESTALLDFEIAMVRSADNGITWTAPITINSNAGSDSGYVDIAAHIATDEAGVWIASWSGTITGTANDRDIFLSRSTDNGETWSPRARLGTNAPSDQPTLAPHLAADNNGNWVAVCDTWDTQGGTLPSGIHIFASYSSDGGTSWSSPQSISTALGSATVLVPVVATDRLGHWVVSYTEQGAFGTDYDVIVQTSSDNGHNWSAPAALNSDAGTDARTDSYASIVSDGLGVWYAAWSSGESTGSNLGDDGDPLFALSLIHI